VNAILDLIARMDDDLVAGRESSDDLGFETVLTADLYRLLVNSAVDHFENRGLFTNAK